MLQLKKFGGLAAGRTDEASAMGAMPGAQPHGVAGRRMTAVADVVAVNRAKQTVTLRGPQLTAEVRVSDVNQFNHIKKGDQVTVTYTQALAMVVEPSPKKSSQGFLSGRLAGRARPLRVEAVWERQIYVTMPCQHVRKRFG